MKQHVEDMKEGLQLVMDGMRKFNGGPAEYTLDVLFAAYDALATRYAPFKVRDRVELVSPPIVDAGSGWWWCRHFLVPGNIATVVQVRCDALGFLQFDVVFDRETWIDRNGHEQSVETRHSFCFSERSLKAAAVPGMAGPHSGAAITSDAEIP